jgi:hypothetical protein
MSVERQPDQRMLYVANCPLLAGESLLVVTATRQRSRLPALAGDWGR